MENTENELEPIKKELEEIVGSESSKDLDKIQILADAVRQEVGKLIIGQEKMVDLMVIAILCGGHVLLEGVPGVAKTLAAKALAKTLSVKFSRIQFTPDLMPSDVIGTTIFNQKQSEFSFKPGPVFANMVLIDEINRSPAKTQAALFEVMEERQITVDGITHSFSYPFIVIATQNPVEQEGTYKLPEAQLDRFLFRIKVAYPSLEEEVKMLHRYKKTSNAEELTKIVEVLNPKSIQAAADICDSILIKDELVLYIAQLIQNTRNNGDLFLGASPRASLAIMKASKAHAAINGRSFVIPEDIQEIAYSVLNHRMILMPEREMEGTEIEDVIRDIIQKVEVPR